jgi:hypothetical protein
MGDRFARNEPASRDFVSLSSSKEERVGVRSPGGTGETSFDVQSSELGVRCSGFTGRAEETILID